MATLKEIETKTKKYADARAELASAVRELREKQEQLTRKYLPLVKRSVAAAKDAESALRAEIETSPELFSKPKTLVLHGIKVGFKKGAGKIEFGDADKVVKLIRKHFPEQFDVLVKTTKKPIKDALSNLAADDLKKLGITVESTGDVVLVKDTASDIDKLVSALLKEDEEEVEA